MRLAIFTRRYSGDIVEKIGTTSIHFCQKVVRDNLVLVESKTIRVCVGGDFQDKAVAADIRKSIQIC